MDGSILLLNFAYKRLLNKPYENEVTLNGQNPPLKCCQPLELLTQLKKSLDPGGMAEAANFFLRTPNLTASNFKAL